MSGAKSQLGFFFLITFALPHNNVCISSDPLKKAEFHHVMCIRLPLVVTSLCILRCGKSV